MKKLSRILCLVLVLALAVPFLSSCAQNKTIIGKVGEHNVFYDELYYMVHYYKASVIEELGDNPAAVRNELNAIVNKEILTNYAFLELCEDNGLYYEDIEDEVDEAFEKYITAQYGGDKSTFKKNIKALGLSERYVKYTIGLDLLYSYLIQSYINNKKLLTDEGKIIDYIKSNFIRTNHLAIFNDESDDVKKNRAKITDAKQKLDSGSSISDLIRAGYTEDFNDLDGSGYYFARNTMIPEYENAAYNLSIGKYSDIVEAHAENSLGEYVSCYYIIERLSLSNDYINTNLDQLKTEYYQSVINGDIAKKAAGLEFSPNAKYNSMDLYDLSPSADMTLTIVVISVISAAVIAAVIIIVVKLNLKKKNISYKSKSIRRK